MGECVGTVVIVNWNGGEPALAAVGSVLAQTIAPALHAVVVDNGSTDGSAEAIASAFGERVHLARSDANLGFAGGNNLGFRHARGKYLLLLNNDAVAEPGWAQTLVEAAEQHPGVGMCTSKILCDPERTRIDTVGHSLYPDGLNRSRGHLARDRGQFEQVAETLFPSGCAALYLREAVLSQGGFDEDFFAYGDDADLGLKLRLLNYRCLYVPAAVVYHRQSASTGRRSLQKIFWIERNRVWVMLKYFPADWILTSPMYTFLRLWAGFRAGRRRKGLAGDVLSAHGTRDLAGTIVRAWAAALAGAPRMLAKRRVLMRSRRVSGREWRALLRLHAATVGEMSFGEPPC